MRRGEDAIRVLVVDDDEGMVATLRDILGAAGYEVDVAYSVVDRRRSARGNPQ